MYISTMRLEGLRHVGYGTNWFSKYMYMYLSKNTSAEKNFLSAFRQLSS